MEFWLVALPVVIGNVSQTRLLKLKGDMYFAPPVKIYLNMANSRLRKSPRRWDMDLQAECSEQPQCRHQDCRRHLHFLLKLLKILSELDKHTESPLKPSFAQYVQILLSWSLQKSLEEFYHRGVSPKLHELNNFSHLQLVKDRKITLVIFRLNHI